jgi:hypothetical protein
MASEKMFTEISIWQQQLMDHWSKTRLLTLLQIVVSETLRLHVIHLTYQKIELQTGK